ncbi:junctional adhesion molecule-like isoform X2 [Arvicola amphibius]|uniref:junctional adhesion molecule-like isoform X2 n=1 Tax=Arvicola amphibius TaxID=1047088 RepID=UPI0018E304CF|nr:junctional adhesion molecule-like isoform X2 [Arvicola amphibius]
MFRLLKLIVIPVILAPVGDSQGLSDTAVSSPQLRVHVGDSAFMGCVVQSAEEKHVVKVDWILSKGERAVSEYVLYYYSNLSVPTGRFQNRSLLVGDVLQNDGSLLLQDVQEADQGTYTCEIRFESESRVFKKSVELFVLPEEPKELTVHVGDSTEMGCFFQSTKKKHVTKVEWMFSSGKHATEEVVLRCDSSVPRGHSQSQGRFQNRVNLMGDISQNDGSIMFQTVKLSDQGTYTCHIYLGKLESRKTIVLRVIQEEPQRSISTTPRPKTHQPVTLDGNQLVIIVGIICTTLLLFPVLILIVKKTQWNKSSVSSMASLKSLESKEKANPEKHVYSSISTWETTEEGPRGQSEATYMTMHPVWPSLQSDPHNPVGKKKSQLGKFPEPQTF